jgi:hypothetical protein
MDPDKSKLTPPFVVSEGGDLIAFDTLKHVESEIAAYDVESLEFFDATGRRLAATVEGYRVALGADVDAKPEPERLESMLRSYFAGLGAREQRFASYATAADRASSLHELLELRLKLSSEPRHRFRSRARRKLGGHDDEVSG